MPISETDLAISIEQQQSLDEAIDRFFKTKLSAISKFHSDNKKDCLEFRENLNKNRDFQIRVNLNRGIPKDSVYPDAMASLKKHELVYTFTQQMDLLEFYQNLQTDFLNENPPSSLQEQEYINQVFRIRILPFETAAILKHEENSKKIKEEQKSDAEQFKKTKVKDTEAKLSYADVVRKGSRGAGKG